MILAATSSQALHLIALSSPNCPAAVKLNAWLHSPSPTVALTAAQNTQWGPAAATWHHTPDAEHVTLDDFDDLTALDDLIVSKVLTTRQTRPPATLAVLPPSTTILGQPIPIPEAARILITHAATSPTQRRFLEDSHAGLYGDDFHTFDTVATIGLPPLRDFFTATTINKSLPIDAYRHPLTWITPRDWANTPSSRLALFLELIAQKWWNPETGMWRDAIHHAGLDLDDPTNRKRLQKWLTGEPDALLDNWRLPLNKDITHQAVAAAIPGGPTLEAFEQASTATFDDPLNFENAAAAYTTHVHDTATTTATQLLQNLDTAYKQVLDEFIKLGETSPTNMPTASPELVVITDVVPAMAAIRSHSVLLDLAILGCLQAAEAFLALPASSMPTRTSQTRTELTTDRDLHGDQCDRAILELSAQVNIDTLKALLTSVTKTYEARLTTALDHIKDLTDTRTVEQTQLQGWGQVPILFAVTELQTPSSNGSALNALSLE